MKLHEIDKNLAVASNVTEPDLVWYDVQQSPFVICGVRFEEESGRFLRMPEAVAASVSDGVHHLNTHTTGGRVRFRTDSPFIAVRAVTEPCHPMSHMPLTGQAGFDLYCIRDGKDTYFRTFIPPASWVDGFASGVKTFGEYTDYTINFPLYHGVKQLYIGLKKDACVHAPTPYRHPAPVVFYGNSITQGGCASRPGNSYQGFLSRRLSTDFINLGFSGSGKGEIPMAEYIASLPMSVLVMDYDSNAPSEAHLRDTYFPFYDLIRKKNPTLPIILVTHPSALHGIYYKTAVDPAVWGTFEGRFAIIKDTYDRAVAGGDRNIYFVDGKELYAGDEWDAVTVDGTHPNDLGFLRFAQRLEQTLAPLLQAASAEKERNVYE